MKSLSTMSLARFCGLYSGIVFGIYWMPLRYLDQAGLPGMWSTTLFNLATMIAVLPFMIYGWRRFLPGRPRFHIISICSGLGYVLYNSSFLFTDVISAIVLFYLMPIWGFILGRIFLKEKITSVRWLSMVVAFAGLWLILGEGSAVPIPNNVGDWMALAAGLFWAGVALMLLTDNNSEKAIHYSAGFIFWATVIAAVSAILVTRAGIHPEPDLRNLPDLWWLLPFAAIVIVPAAVATVYAPTKLNPGVVGLLFMTEISVGTITAAIWAGEPFGGRQLAGVLLVTAAGALEPLLELVKSRKRRRITATG